MRTLPFVMAALMASCATTTPNTWPAPAGIEHWADGINWGKRCDTRSGRIALPLFPQQPCYRPWAGGDNGGATTPGVTATEIKVVIYERQAHDPVHKLAGLIVNVNWR